MPKTVLITGAHGRIGRALTKHLDATGDDDYQLRLADFQKAGGRGVSLDVTDLASCREACEGVDTVIHLAGVPSPDSSFESILSSNIVGTYNIFRAASDAEARRIVFASSAQAIEGYPVDVQVQTTMPVRPKNLYGASKAFGEALGAYFAYQEGLEAVAVRIGAFEHAENWARMSSRDLSAWISPDDLCALFVRCIETNLAQQPFAIAHGISDNRFKRLDLTDTRTRFSYRPQSDAFSTWHMGLQDTSEPAA